VKVAPPDTRSDIERYCGNLLPIATEARTAWQMEQLEAMEKKIAAQTTTLEKMLADYRQWHTKREEFMKKADETAVAIFSKIRPEAAAAQLSLMDDMTAAAFIAKLSARTSSLILAEMDPARAARLTQAVATNGIPTEGGMRP
jgi:flagellar motility protein MotE (MotC chaperone)